MFKSFNKNIIVFLVGLIVLPCFAGSNVFAADVSFTAEVDSRRVELGGAIQLSLTVSGKKDASVVDLPLIDGFDVRYIGPATRVSIVNGSYTSSVSYNYSLFAVKSGTFQIPSVSIMVDGQALSTNPIQIEVFDSQGQGVQQGSSGAASQSNQQVSLSERLFLNVKTSKSTLYLGEPLIVKMYLFVNGVAVRDIEPPKIDNVGFTIEDYEEPKQYQQVVDGIRYDIVEFSKVLYPTRIGRIELGPISVSCNVLLASKSSSRRRSFGSMFGDDFFDSFFDRRQRRPVNVQSGKGIIEVLDLPKEGRPADFSGGVGSYDFNVEVSPTEVNEGDPITLRMKVSGQGNIDSVNFPSIRETNQLKLYDPQITRDNGTKILEQVIIPRSSNLKEIPSIDFSYFDSRLGKYSTITKGPFPIAVKEVEGGEGLRIVASDPQSTSYVDEELGSDIVFIKSDMGTLREIGTKNYKSPLFYAIIFIAFLVWGAVFIYYQKTLRLQTDAVYAKRKHAPKFAKKQMEKAKRFLKDEEKEEFYDCIFKTLQKYFANKLHMPVGTITFDAVISKGAKSKTKLGIPSDIVSKLKRIFEECDIVRYAAGQISYDIMSRSFKDLEEIIDFYERKF